MKVSQSSWFGSNTVNTTTSPGMGGLVLAIGAGAACVVFAFTLATLLGGAMALVIVVLGSTLAGCLALTTLVRRGMEVHRYRRTGELPPTRPLILRNTVQYPALEAPQHAPRMRVTRADYTDDWHGRAYSERRDR